MDKNENIRINFVKHKTHWTLDKYFNRKSINLVNYEIHYNQQLNKLLTSLCAVTADSYCIIVQVLTI